MVNIILSYANLVGFSELFGGLHLVILLLILSLTASFLQRSMCVTTYFLQGPWLTFFSTQAILMALATHLSLTTATSKKQPG
jgi:hypothetical protein